MMNNNEWTDIEEDLPLNDTRYQRLSVPIDILMADGTIHRNGFCTLDDEEFYVCSNGGCKKLEYDKVKAWRAAE